MSAERGCVAEWRRAAAKRLRSTSASPALDADLMLASVLGVERVQLITHPERTLTTTELVAANDLLERRAQHEPMAYLLGYKGFAGIALAVSPAVLVPRPATETLVEAVLARCDHAPRVVADLGTGSGAIALALADARGTWTIVATDREQNALAVAWDNALRHELVQVRLLQADWTAPFASASLDVLVSNPPYVAQGDSIDPELRFEPAGALFAGADGLAALRLIAADAARVLRPGGFVCLEHGARQGAAVRQLLAASGMCAITTVQDLEGHERVTCGQRP